MQTLNLEDGKTALVIVAHPDDETIWLGGTIMKHPRVQWTIFSLCRASDADRAPKFQRVCQHYGAQALIADLDDEDGLTTTASIAEIKKLILQKITKPFDYLFTHGANGEYGHPRHQETHQAIINLLNQQQLVAHSAFVFNYKILSRKNGFAKLGSGHHSDYLVTLSQEDLMKKKSIMTDIYGFAPDGPDVGYCTDAEALLLIKQNN